jgi:hypothetical protein
MDNSQDGIGLREHTQETPIFDGKNPWCPGEFSLNKSVEDLITKLSPVYPHYIPMISP